MTLLALKKSVKKDDHTGIQPTRVLQQNIIDRFENTNKDFLRIAKEIIQNSGLKPGISYLISEESIQTPFVDSNKKMAIHETFLSYLWIVCYSMIVLYDEGIVKPLQNIKNGQSNHQIDKNKIQAAEDLLAYGRSLIRIYAPWDKGKLPNPEEFSEDEEYYVLRTNNLFTSAINFILCHEFAHIEQKHLDIIIKGSVEDHQIKVFEKEADNRAIEFILAGKDGINDKSIELGGLMGLSSMLFFRKETYGGERHPDTDSRIKNYLEKINPAIEHPIWGIAALFFKIWERQFDLNFNWPKEKNDYKELFYNILEQIENDKQSRKIG